MVWLSPPLTSTERPIRSRIRCIQRTRWCNGSNEGPAPAPRAAHVRRSRVRRWPLTRARLRCCCHRPRAICTRARYMHTQNPTPPPGRLASCTTEPSGSGNGEEMRHPPDSEQHHHAEFGELHLLCWTSILVELSQHVPDLRERLCGWWVGAGRCGVLGNAVGGVSWGWGGA